MDASQLGGLEEDGTVVEKLGTHNLWVSRWRCGYDWSMVALGVSSGDDRLFVETGFTVWSSWYLYILQSCLPVFSSMITITFTNQPQHSK